MKLPLAFAFLGITCCLAVPFCSKEEIEKCSQGPPEQYGSEEDILNRVCKETKCWLKIYDRCGTDIFGMKGAFPGKGYHKVVDEVCDGPLREKYLENAECIRRETKDLKSLLNRCDIKDRPREEFCRLIPDGMKCATNYVIEKCGDDAGDVFRVAALPGLDPYDCLTKSQ